MSPQDDSNPFSPPVADLQSHGAMPGSVVSIRYRLRRRDYFLWNVFHLVRARRADA